MTDSSRLVAPRMESGLTKEEAERRAAEAERKIKKDMERVLGK